MRAASATADLWPGPGEAALHRLQREHWGGEIRGAGQILQSGEGLADVAGPHGALQKAIVRRRGAPFARPDQHFGDPGRRGHGRIADTLGKIDGEALFAGMGGSNGGADATLDGGFDTHPPHQKTKLLDARPACAAEGQIHQHRADHVLRRGGRHEQPAARAAPDVQQAASLQNDHGFPTGRPPESQVLLNLREAAKGLADRPAPLQQMHFHGRHRFVGQIARRIVGADDAGHQPLGISGRLPQAVVHGFFPASGARLHWHRPLSNR